MNLLITRGKSRPEGTPGKLTSDFDFSCDTLELMWQNNKTGVSCILPDTYEAKVWFSPHLGRKVLRLEDKHGRKDCLLHNANFAGEGVGEITQIHGCTAVGKNYSMIGKPDGTGSQFGILDSNAMLQNLISRITGQMDDAPIMVTYVWGEGCEPEDVTDLNAAQP